MLDVFIFFGTILALTFFIISKKWFSGWAMFISAVLFLVIGMGIFVSGWETQDNAPITLTVLSSTVTEITFGTTVVNPILDGDPSSQIVFTIAMFFVTLGLILVFVAIQESVLNKEAKKRDD